MLLGDYEQAASEQGVMGCDEVNKARENVSIQFEAEEIECKKDLREKETSKGDQCIKDHCEKPAFEQHDMKQEEINDVGNMCSIELIEEVGGEKELMDREILNGDDQSEEDDGQKSSFKQGDKDTDINDVENNKCSIEMIEEIGGDTELMDREIRNGDDHSEEESLDFYDASESSEENKEAGGLTPNVSDENCQSRKRSYAYTCAKCDRVCSGPSALKVHLSRHRENLYSCQQCEFSTSRPSALKHHSRVDHRADMPLACSKCSFSTKWSMVLTRHMKEEHGEPLSRMDKCTIM